jgi:hypothetical protein
VERALFGLGRDDCLVMWYPILIAGMNKYFWNPSEHGLCRHMCDYYEEFRIRISGLFCLCRQRRLVGRRGTSLRRRLRRRGRGDRVLVCGFWCPRLLMLCLLMRRRGDESHWTRSIDIQVPHGLVTSLWIWKLARLWDLERTFHLDRPKVWLNYRMMQRLCIVHLARKIRDLSVFDVLNSAIT